MLKNITLPTLVYKCPGDHQRSGGTYGFIQAIDAEQLDAFLADGWYATLEEAINAVDSPSKDTETETKRKYTKAVK